MLPGKIGVFGFILGCGLATLLASAALLAADRGIVPISVCEAVRDLPAHEGQTVAVVGRYCYRTSAHWLDQQGCQPATTVPAAMWVVENLETAPKAPEVFEFDAVELDKRLLEVQQHTPLGRFRFGSTDYDRWAVVYGRVESHKGEDPAKFGASLVIRGNRMIIFLPRP